MTAVVLCWCIDCIYNKSKDGVCACDLSTIAITPKGCTRYTKCNNTPIRES